MILKHFRNVTLVLCLLAPMAQAAARGSSVDEAVLTAYDAYHAGDPMKLARAAQALPKDYALAPYVAYWTLSLRLEDASDADVQAFLDKYPGTYVAKLLRADWLKVLGQRADWADFEKERASVASPDLETSCYAWLARIARGERVALRALNSIWLEPGELPDGCNALVDQLAARNAIDVGDVWRRVRVLFENGQIAAAKRTLDYLPKGESPNESNLTLAATHPQKLLGRVPLSAKTRADRELLVLAAVRLARKDVRAVADALQGRLASVLGDGDRAYLWAWVGYQGALAHEDQALQWYAEAGDYALSDTQREWQARAALRAGDWQAVREAIDGMSPQASRLSAWTYWYGRALAAQGDPEAARAYYMRIAGSTDFYSVLAAEELGFLATAPKDGYVPTEAEVAAVAARPGILRALELYRLDLRTEGALEWGYALRGMDDRQLLAAAEVARRAELFDRSITTADMTRRVNNFELRYPAPYRDVFAEFAREHGVDEAWVLGLVRQESHFIVDAHSAAGARGLMQLMPRTARWVAHKIGLKHYHPGHVAEVKTNITLGTGYLKLVLDNLGHEVLASAAYNAGPGRARSWRDAKPLEGAIYAENIPFDETRRYVKKVMANAIFYASLYGDGPSSLKARLGMISSDDPSSGGDATLP
ncbi:MAG TPA: transglycosylase SLT domain-containing protein [Burkholderiales bacterium]|nr:transglycosylase SLT domain-containing protein [Burkholderiales bacterium]